MPVTRRTVLGLLSSSTFFLSVPLRGEEAETPQPGPMPPLSFEHGVASGDPRTDSVMLWTRAAPQQADHVAEVPLLLQLSETEAFDTIFYEAALSTNVDADFTVRAFVDGLQADRYYFYRFLGGDGTRSRTGRTRTAPGPDQDAPVKVAFVSCQGYEQSYYTAWARMIAEDKAADEGENIDFVLHLGDFIYERSWNKRYDGSDQARYVPAFPDGARTDENRYAVSLADYRHIYKTYLSDPWLQEARARWPFVCTWDDHEFSNDNFQSYSYYGDKPKLEAQRKYEANQAWFEYIPAVLDEIGDSPAHNFRDNENLAGDEDPNTAARDSLCIYRNINWGRNLDVVLTDTRSYRTPPCMDRHMAASLGLPLASSQLIAIADGGKDYNNGNPPELLPYGEGKTVNPWREREPGSLLGPTQRAWFLDQLESSSARWKLWGNAIPLLPMRVDLSSIPLAGYQDSPLTIDSWEGFPHEVDYLLSEIESRKIGGVVSLSGDHHLHGAGTIQGSSSSAPQQPVIADFAVAAISSSPIFEDIKANAGGDSSAFMPLVRTEVDGVEQAMWNLTLLQGALAAYAFDSTGIETLVGMLGPNEANPGLKFIDSNTNGYGTAKFADGKMTVSLVSVPPAHTPFAEAPAISYTARFTLPLWEGGQQPELAGPEFEGTRPFPYAWS